MKSAAAPAVGQIAKPLRVIHLVAEIGRSSFGVGQVVVSLVKHQLALGVDAEIWSLDTAEEAAVVTAASGIAASTIRTFPPFGPRALSFSLAMLRAAHDRTGERADVVHQHCLWALTSLATNRWRRRYGKATVITPHGMLESWALKRSAWKKRGALLVYERHNLREASCLHALSGVEADSFRAFGLRNPIATIPNGIATEWLASTGDARRFRRRFNVADSQRVLLSLSRITPVKGLPLLVEALHAVRAALPEWVLLVAGVDQDGHQQAVESLVKQLGMQKQVRFVGPLFGQEKRDAFAATDLFVLASHHEAAPMVVLEALGAGVPVLTTKGTPWEELNTRQCGWWIDIGPEPLAAALREAMALSDEQRRNMGARGRRLVEEQYAWPKIARDMCAVYEWVLGGGSPPACTRMA